MKKSKLIALASAISMVASMSFCFTTTYANVTEGVVLDLVSATDTEKTVSLTYVGELKTICGYELVIEMPEGVAVTSFTGVVGGENAKSNPGNVKLTAFNSMCEGPETNGNLNFATLTLSVPADMGEFTLTLDGTDDLKYYIEDNDGMTPSTAASKTSLTIPGAKPAGPTPIDANKLGTYAEHDDAVVTAYTAIVPAADVDKTFEWGFKNADGVASDFTQTAKFEYKTVVSGEAGIVLGLKVVGDMPEDINATLTVVE